MSSPFVGEIKMFGGNFAPVGFATCDGQILPISQNTALFSLLGTYYGGNGTSNFALPNLQGNFPMFFGNGAGLTPRVIGETGGEAQVTLTLQEIPAHTHLPQCNSAGGSADSPANSFWAMPHEGKAPVMAYSDSVSSNTTAMNAQALGQTGGSQPHNNIPPYLVLTFIIALQGIYPARS